MLGWILKQIHVCFVGPRWFVRQMSISYRFWFDTFVDILVVSLISIDNF